MMIIIIMIIMMFMKNMNVKEEPSHHNDRSRGTFTPNEPTSPARETATMKTHGPKPMIIKLRNLPNGVRQYH